MALNARLTGSYKRLREFSTRDAFGPGRVLSILSVVASLKQYYLSAVHSSVSVFVMEAGLGLFTGSRTLAAFYCTIRCRK
jgi:hypothetical protein